MKINFLYNYQVKEFFFLTGFEQWRLYGIANKILKNNTAICKCTRNIFVFT